MWVSRVVLDGGGGKVHVRRVTEWFVGCVASYSSSQCQRVLLLFAVCSYCLQFRVGGFVLPLRLLVMSLLLLCCFSRRLRFTTSTLTKLPMPFSKFRSSCALLCVFFYVRHALSQQPRV